MSAAGGLSLGRVTRRPVGSWTNLRGSSRPRRRTSSTLAGCWGLAVPRDISIVGFDDIRLAEFTEPPLTTVRLSRQELAEHAFAALLSDLSDQPQPRREYTVETHLVIRESTCRVR